MHHSREAAETILEPHMDTLAGLFPAAWDRWEQLGEEAPDLRLQLCGRSRASMLHNLAATSARTLFADMAPDVTLHETRGLLLIGFNSELYLRLKKYRNASYRTSGIPTGQQQSFAAQEPLTGMLESTNLVLGYVLNPMATEIASTAITCSTDDSLNWVIDVPIPGRAIVVDQPVSDTVEPATPEISSTLLEREEDEGISGR